MGLTFQLPKGQKNKKINFYIPLCFKRYFLSESLGILRSGSLALLPTGQYRRWKSEEKESERIGGKGVSPLAMGEGFGANCAKPSRGARERKKL